MATGKKVFLIGPGFIGWNVLELLVSEGYEVTALVRRREHAEALESSSGSRTIAGEIDDRGLVEETTVEHDVIVHTATADHLPSVEAVLDGIAKRADRGLSTIYIHTSGTSVLNDGAEGRFKGDKIYRDEHRNDIDTLPDEAPHRVVDLAIARAAMHLGEKAKIAIMTPPLIYGYNPRHDRLSIQIPHLTRFALKHGYAAHVGDGLSVESNVHVLDLARGYVVLLHHLETAQASEVLKNPYYFCESTGDNEPSWREVAEFIGESLHNAGRIADPKPRKMPPDLYKDVGEDTHIHFGTNSRSRAVRLRALGWQPREKDWRRSYVEDELPVILKRHGA